MRSATRASAARTSPERDGVTHATAGGATGDEGDSGALTPGRPAWSGIPWRRLLGYLRPHLGAFAVAVGALLAGLVAGLLMPLAIGEFVSLVLAGDAAGMARMLGFLAALALGLAVASLVQTRTLGVIG